MSAAITAVVIAAVGAAFSGAYTIYGAVNTPDAKLPTTQRNRARQIETKLIPALQKKLAAEQSKPNPNQENLRKILQDIQDLDDEQKYLLRSLDEAHAEAQGLSSKDAAAPGPIVTPARKLNPNALALAGAGIVAVSIVGVAAVIAKRKKSRG